MMELEDVVAEASNPDAYVVKQWADNTDGPYILLVTVYSADLSQKTVYELLFKNTGQGIESVATTPATTVLYNMNGQQVLSHKAGQVVIERRADGHVVKVRK